MIGESVISGDQHLDMWSVFFEKLWNMLQGLGNWTAFAHIFNINSNFSFQMYFKVLTKAPFTWDSILWILFCVCVSVLYLQKTVF